MVVIPLVIRRTRQVPPQADPDRLADMVKGNHFFGVIHAMQQRSEITGLLRELESLRPRRILEIGTAGGGTLFMMSRWVHPQALLISLDLPAGMFGGGYSRWKLPVYRSMVLPGQRIELIRADSHAPQSLEQVKAALAGEPLDFLFIDGDHSYAGVKSDFEQYAPLVRSGGLIAFHDIVDHPDYNAGGDVPRFWRELARTRDVREFIENPNGGYGIGLLSN
jgi:predicted O-methyltransferase YrrM